MTRTQSAPLRIKDIKKGGIFQRGKTVYVRNHYDATSKRYSVSKYDDLNSERFMKGSIVVIEPTH